MKTTKYHEWVKLEGDIATVGLTHKAQDELGEVVFVELPSLKSHVKAGNEVAVLESTKAAIDLYAPVSGEIVDINYELKRTPELINNSPEEKGWLYRLRVPNTDEYDEL